MISLGGILDNSTTKSIAISIIMGILGYTSHVLLDSESQKTIIEAHTKQIEHLFVDATEQKKSQSDLNITVARIEGKIDVLNQKIDDDRRSPNQRHSTR